MNQVAKDLAQQFNVLLQEVPGRRTLLVFDECNPPPQAVVNALLYFTRFVKLLPSSREPEFKSHEWLERKSA